MKKLLKKRLVAGLALASVFGLGLTSCSSGGDSSGGTSGDGGAAGEIPSWCGPDEVVFGYAAGFGANSWQVIVERMAQVEAEKCPSVVDYIYTDGQGDTQKSISDINGMVAMGVNAMIVFATAGEAVLPALQQATEAGVAVVPFRLNPGGEAGVDFTAYASGNIDHEASLWSDWVLENFPDGANILVVGGPQGNENGLLRDAVIREKLGDPKYNFVGQQPFEPTDWDPAKTQQVLTSAIAQNEKIDVILSDFGPSLLGALPAFEANGRSIPAIATSDGNGLACFYEDHKADNPDFQLMTVSAGQDNVLPAVHYAIAAASGGELPESADYMPVKFEDTFDAENYPVRCEREFSADISVSASLSPAEQDALLK